MDLKTKIELHGSEIAGKAFKNAVKFQFQKRKKDRAKTLRFYFYEHYFRHAV